MKRPTTSAVRCERLKVLTFAEGMYAISTVSDAPPCRYTVRWCPKDGHILTLATDVRAPTVFKVVRQHRVLGDTIEHLMQLPLDV
jgi:hypothetical protein